MNGPRINLSGTRFGRLVVLSLAGRCGIGEFKWLCACDCGQTVSVRRTNLQTGDSQSCGCLQKARTSETSRTHGKTGSREFRIWEAMKRRCNNPNDTGYRNYGGRGISVCSRWQHSFPNFLADMGACPRGMSLERKENDKGYSKENCKWATRAEQSRNRRNNRNILLRGECLCVKDWATRLGCDHRTLHARLNADWPIEKALTQPLRAMSSPRKLSPA